MRAFARTRVVPRFSLPAPRARVLRRARDVRVRCRHRQHAQRHRHGQPGEQEGYGYETCQKVRENWEGIVETVFESSEMPPGGAVRVSDPEKLALARWWQQGGRCD